MTLYGRAVRGAEAGVIAMSAGNHALALAYHGQRLGVPVTLVMPRFTPSVKVEHTRGFSAEVILHGDDLEAAHARAVAEAERRGLVFVHPYDDEDVMRGQATAGLEMIEQQPELELLVVPVGGGGLIAGVASAARVLAPSMQVVGVEAERFPSMHQALAGKPITCGPATLAEGIAVKQH